MDRFLIYHTIGPYSNKEIGAELYCVSEEKFKEQMRYLAGVTETPGHQVTIITFDDGDITNYTHAYPVLKEKGLKAHFFILVGKVGESGYMNWQQIKELWNAGMAIGSHGMTHRILTVLSEKEMDYELRESRRILERQLDSEIKYLSIPRGFCNKKVIKKTKEAGYKTVFTSNPGDDDGFLRGRIAVKANWDLAKFTRVVNNGLSFADLAEEFIKNLLKKLFGAGNYDKLRNHLLK